MRRLLFLVLILLLAACDSDSSSNNSGASGDGETGRVVRVVDGDTIEVDMNGERMRVRYVGVNTPEQDETCYAEAAATNRALVDGQTVRLVRDTSDTDRFDRLLRYVYVGSIFVNAELIRGGHAEVVLYEPDDRHYNEFREMEREAANLGRGCHPTGIFDDGSDRR